jgi:hypothetical protein
MSSPAPDRPTRCQPPARRRLRWAPLVLALGTAALTTACLYDGGRRGSRYGYGDPYSRSDPYYRSGRSYDPYYRSGRYGDPRWHDRREWDDDRHEHGDRYEHGDRHESSRPTRRPLEETERWQDMRRGQKDDLRDLQRSQARERERLKATGEWDKQDKQRQRAVTREVQERQKEQRDEVRDDYQDRRR